MPLNCCFLIFFFFFFSILSLLSSECECKLLRPLLLPDARLCLLLLGGNQFWRDAQAGATIGEMMLLLLLLPRLNITLPNALHFTPQSCTLSVDVCSFFIASSLLLCAASVFCEHGRQRWALRRLNVCSFSFHGKHLFVVQSFLPFNEFQVCIVNVDLVKCCVLIIFKKCSY